MTVRVSKQDKKTSEGGKEENPGMAVRVSRETSGRDQALGNRKEQGKVAEVQQTKTKHTETGGEGGRQGGMESSVRLVMQAIHSTAKIGHTTGSERLKKAGRERVRPGPNS